MRVVILFWYLAWVIITLVTVTIACIGFGPAYDAIFPKPTMTDAHKAWLDSKDTLFLWVGIGIFVLDISLFYIVRSVLITWYRAYIVRSLLSTCDQAKQFQQ